MEGAEITVERLEHVSRALASSRLRNQVFSAHLGETTREDFIPYTADFLLQVEDVKWTIVSGVVGGQLIVSVRNLGYSRNAGEFVKATFGDIGSAGGHRAMAKAVVPMERFRTKFGDLNSLGIATRIGDLAESFLSEAADKKPQHEKATP
jgi:nanoRNase/pAp phosphatase (c-di-AMP/oligoRNAs hydrolase)